MEPDKPQPSEDRQDSQEEEVCIDANPGPGKPHTSFTSLAPTQEELERLARDIDESPTG